MSNTTTQPPRIGQHWPEQGGIYCGILAGRDGQPDSHLVMCPPEHEINSIIWGRYGQDVSGATSYWDGISNTRAMAAAGSQMAVDILALQIDGHADWHLPSQAEAHLMAANVKELMAKDWYWTSTQYSDDYAWIQGFTYGSQDDGHKGAKARARAVRRLVL